MKIKVKKIKISEIERNDKTQSREKINDVVVEEYAEAVREGANFPPVVLFYDGKNYHIGDGWHRIFAYKNSRVKTIEAEIKPGGLRDAIIYSVGSNATHGLRRTNQDKRKAVAMLLQDKEWAQWSDREIAKKAVVGHSFVSNMRKELSVHDGQMDVKRIKRGTKEYTIKTDKIGKKTNKYRVKTANHKETFKSEEKATDNSITNEFSENTMVEKVLFKIFGWEIVAKKNK